MDTKMSPLEQGYTDGLNGKLGVHLHEEPKNKVQEEENKQYKEGWHQGCAEFKKQKKLRKG